MAHRIRGLHTRCDDCLSGDQSVQDESAQHFSLRGLQALSVSLSGSAFAQGPFRDNILHLHCGTVTDDHCPIGHEDHHNAEESPLHCHAFNGVDFVKYTYTGELQPLRVVSSMVTTDSRILPDPYAAGDFHWYLCMKIPDKSIDHTGANTLRAPPACMNFS